MNGGKEDQIAGGLALVALVALVATGFALLSRPPSSVHVDGAVPSPKSVTVAHGGQPDAGPILAAQLRWFSTPPATPRPDPPAGNVLEVVLPVSQTACARLAARLSGTCGARRLPSARLAGITLQWSDATRVTVTAQGPFDFTARWPASSDANWRVATHNLSFVSPRITAKFDCLENRSFSLLVPGQKLRPIRCVVSESRLRLAVALNEASPDLALGGVDRMRAHMLATTVESESDGGTLVADDTEHRLGETAATVIESQHEAGVGFSLTAREGAPNTEFAAAGPRIASATVDGKEMVPTVFSRHEGPVALLVGLAVSVLLWWFEVPKRWRRR